MENKGEKQQKNMSPSAENLRYYGKNAESYCSSTVGADMSFCLEKFLGYLPKQGQVLDAGCGSGRDSLYMQKRGYQVEAFDASRKICAWAEKYTGIPVMQLSFEKMEIQEKYHGIWACASLLHVAEEDMDDVFLRLHHALRRQGILYASFKRGTGRRIKEGRYFTDHTETSLKKLAENTGFSVVECFLTGDVRSEYEGQIWVNLIARKE